MDFNNYNNAYMPYMNAFETMPLMNMDFMNMDFMNTNIEDMYPEIYKCMYPHVKNVVNEIMYANPGNFVLNENVLNSINNEVLNRCNLCMNSYMEDDPPAATFGFGRSDDRRGDFGRNDFGRSDFDRDDFGRGNFMSGRNRRPGNNRRFFGDLARILVLRELLGRF